MDPVNVLAKFEIRSFTPSWDRMNEIYSSVADMNWCSLLKTECYIKRSQSSTPTFPTHSDILMPRSIRFTPLPLGAAFTTPAFYAPTPRGHSYTLRYFPGKYTIIICLESSHSAPYLHLLYCWIVRSPCKQYDGINIIYVYLYYRRQQLIAVRYCALR